MASYSLVGELIDGTLTVVDPVNRIIYGYGNSGDINYYDCIGDTNGTVVRPGDSISLAFFQSNLYALWVDSPFAAGISRWNGATWVEVFSAPAEAIGSFSAYLIALRDTVLVANVNFYQTGDTVLAPTVYYSSNGSDWSPGTIEGENDIVIRGHNDPAFYLAGDSLYLHGCREPLGHPDQSTDIWRWAGSNWALLTTDFGNMVSTYPKLTSVSPDKFWRKGGASDSEYSSDLLSWTDSPASGYGAQRIVVEANFNTAATFGYYYNGVSAFDLVWNNGGSSWDSTPFGSWNPGTYSIPIKWIRMNNGQMYIISPNVGLSGGNYILVRSELVPASPNWSESVGGSLYVYKTTDKGVSWTTRKVET